MVIIYICFLHFLTPRKALFLCFDYVELKVLCDMFP